MCFPQALRAYAHFTPEFVIRANSSGLKRAGLTREQGARALHWHGLDAGAAAYLPATAGVDLKQAIADTISLPEAIYDCETIDLDADWREFELGGGAS